MSSTSKSSCEICNENVANYRCPRCGREYCSVRCYKSISHSSCSEPFYKDWVESYLKEKTFNDEEKLKMIKILEKRNQETANYEDEISSHSLTFEFGSSPLTMDMWLQLTETERNGFMELLQNEKYLARLIPIVEPWWTSKKVKRIVDLDEKIERSDFPPHPMNVKRLSEITNKKPSECLKYNLVNVLYTYSFLFRLYNGDVRDFLEEFPKNLFQLSPALTGEMNYHSLQEAVQDCIRLILMSDLNISLEFAKNICYDVNCILEGPENAPSTYFALCALHDVKLILSTIKKDGPRKIRPIIKKIEFYMSWCVQGCHFSVLKTEFRLFKSLSDGILS